MMIHDYYDYLLITREIPRVCMIIQWYVLVYP